MSFGNWTLPCVAPIRTPPPMPNATLLTLFIFIRHGMRSPDQLWHLKGNEGKWICDGLLENISIFKNVTINGYKYIPTKLKSEIIFPPSCHKGELLDEGVREEYDLGKMYKKYIVDEHKLLPSNNIYNKELFYARTSHYDRCIDSAISFMSGFFSDNINNTKDLNYSVDFETGKAFDEPLAPAPGGSKLMYLETLKFIETDEYLRRIKRVRELSELIKDELNVTLDIHEIQLLILGDYLNALRCSAQKVGIPKKLTKEIHEELMEHLNFFETGFFKFSLPSALGPLYEIILKRINDYYGLKTHSKVNFFSAHDGTLAALLVGIGHPKEGYPPPFASHFLAELWYADRPYIRFVLNGEVLKTQPLSEFKEEAEKVVLRYREMMEEIKESGGKVQGVKI